MIKFAIHLLFQTVNFRFQAVNLIIEIVDLLIQTSDLPFHTVKFAFKADKLGFHNVDLAVQLPAHILYSAADQLMFSIKILESCSQVFDIVLNIDSRPCPLDVISPHVFRIPGMDFVLSFF